MAFHLSGIFALALTYRTVSKLYDDFDSVVVTLNSSFW